MNIVTVNMGDLVLASMNVKASMNKCEEAGVRDGGKVNSTMNQNPKQKVVMAQR